jgi:lipoyl(octanoyl) transferase
LPTPQAYNFNRTVISVVQLGQLDYGEGLRLQQKLVNLRKAGEIGDVLLLLEHSPVITLGRNAKAGNVLASTEALAARGVQVFECDRGGDVTFHGPGQLVAYPIFDLRSHPCGADAPVRENSVPRKTLGVIDYVRRLEEVLIRTCGDFGIATNRIKGLTGVWTATEHVSDFQNHNKARSEAKIAAIGVHIARSVTSHGFALNVNTDLSYFNLIIPCGITAKPVTSMQKELGHEVDIIEVAQAVSKNFGTVFQSQMLWVETIDALLGRVIGIPMRHPADLRKLHEADDTHWS